MGQVGQPVLKNGKFFREYQIEAGDILSKVCLRFGVRNWKRVYDSPENAEFRARFPDPDNILPVTTPHLFIPLIGQESGGKKLRVTWIKSFAGIVVRNTAGERMPAFKLRLVLPSEKHEGVEIETFTSGEYIFPAISGGAFIASSDFELVSPEDASTPIPPIVVNTTFKPTSSLPDPTPHFQLKLNELSSVVVRRVFYIICPMCGVTLKTVKREPPTRNNVCPHDGFDLTSLEDLIETEEQSFLTPPLTKQNPQATPITLKCRGSERWDLAHGQVTVYWDESRFALPNQGDYTLAAAPPLRVPRTQNIIGRTTWGAKPPEFSPVGGEPRQYSFHETPAGGSVAAGAKREMYTTAVASNETTRLSNGVLRWITVHHSADPPSSSFDTPRNLQNKHFIDIGDGGPGADIGYHFVIDSDGTVFEGRALGIKGSHTPAFNGGNVGIVLAGDFERTSQDTPTPAQLAALNNLVEVLTFRFNIMSVWHHEAREGQTGKHGFWGPSDCPGDRLIPEVNKLRSRFPGPPP